ncbi:MULTISPECIES: hypothetical protein [Pseudoalteromonas]|uniref:hypothetical protein n=1 Tax=Pseudoalteromonas TaxID=53246 RepID=UPI001C94BAC2|nr:hypothetical protein [Pseudoalteromonas piscicida]QZO14359.1 hypothetical protein K5642_07630 [Pseudoalteromonas piscicida]
MNTKNQKVTALGELSQAVMPKQMNSILADIDTMLNRAQHTIDMSLQQSSQLIEQSRQHLASIHNALENETQINQSDAHETPYQDTLLQAQVTQLEDQQAQIEQVYTEQEVAARQSAEAAQQAMEETLKNMEKQLMHQNQVFQHDVMQRSADTQGE